MNSIKVNEIFNHDVARDISNLRRYVREIRKVYKHCCAKKKLPAIMLQLFPAIDESKVPKSKLEVYHKVLQNKTNIPPYHMRSSAQYETHEGNQYIKVYFFASYDLI